VSHENRGYQGVKIRLEAVHDSQKEVVPYSLVVGDDWAVRKWSKYIHERRYKCNA
jgi:hypothetical protein